jgi:exonuclease III
MAVDSKRKSGHAGEQGRVRWHSPLDEKADNFGGGIASNLDSVINNVACGFRAGAYNVGQAFGSKIEKILMRANQLSLDFLALSEIGDPKVNDRLIHSYGYRFLTCPKAHAGVMLLFRSAFAPHLRRPLDTGKDGRLVGGHFEIAGQTILLVSAYVQTGVDRMSAESTEFKEAEALDARIQRWTADHSVSRVVVWAT